MYSNDGVIRIIQQLQDGFGLKYAIRMHDEAIIAASLSKDCAFLATATRKTLFFSKIDFENKQTIVPIGFGYWKKILDKAESDTLLDSNMFWGDNNRFLTLFAQKNILFVENPADSNFGCDSTFEIDLNVTAQSIVLTGIMSPLFHKHV